MGVGLVSVLAGFVVVVAPAISARPRWGLPT